MSFEDLSKYAYEDRQKLLLIREVLEASAVSLKCDSLDYSDYSVEPEVLYDKIPLSKYCPECGRRYPDRENFCFDCLVSLKDLKEVNVREIEMDPVFEVAKSNNPDSFEEILTDDNLDKITEFDFTYSKLTGILKNIKRIAFTRLDNTIKENEIFLGSLSVLDKITLFAKSFARIEYKSYGYELGYFEFDRIYVDDRQLPGLQITTILHELSHFLIKEILTHIICEILDCTKTPEIEAIAIFILSSSPVNRLIDEYCAHTVEGRFTLFGYQDYSSYLSIEKTIDAPEEEIEMIKTIGNSFAALIKDILESFIDDDLLDEIKEQFRNDVLDEPNYENLYLENCRLLNDKGMIQAIKMILVDGFSDSMANANTLKDYAKEMKK